MDKPHLLYPINLAPGERLRFTDKPADIWTVRAVDGRFVILTTPARFRPKGTIRYTIIDWETGYRGPTSLLGNWWDFPDPKYPENTETLEEAAQRLMVGLQGPGSLSRDGFKHISTIEISRRQRREVAGIARIPQMGRSEHPSHKWDAQNIHPTNGMTKQDSREHHAQG